MNQYMSKKKFKMSKIKISLFLIVLLTIVIIFFAYSNRHYVKSIVKKNSAVYNVLKKGKGVIDTLLGEKNNILQDIEYAEIVVDAENVIGKIEPFWGGLGYDFFYSVAAQAKNRALFELIKNVNQKRDVFTYYRAHNIFSDKNAPTGEESGGRVYSEDSSGNPVYDWSRVDAIFDVIVDAGMKPIVELGFMPEALTSDPKRIGDWRAANVAPPKDYMKWRNLVYETVNHLESRYGAAEIETWFFEVWNEPDLWRHFWVHDPENQERSNIQEYLKLYDYTVDGAIAANENIKIGGPAIAGWADVFEIFLRHTKSGENYVTGAKGSRIDFISFHKYGYIEENIIHGIKCLIDIALAIDKDKFSSIPFLLDEIGPSTRSREAWKNSPFVAAWMCKFVNAMFELEQNKGPAYRPDATIFWTDVGVNFHEGSGALATVLGIDHNAIIKGPVFNSYDLLSRVSGDRIALSGTDFGDMVHGFAARNADTSVDIVMYKMNDYNPYYKNETDVQLVVKNLPFQKYYLNYFLIDEMHSNAFHEWKKMGSPAKATSSQLQVLQNNDDLELAEFVSQGVVSNGQVVKQIKMKSNCALLLKLSKVTDFTPPVSPVKLTASGIGRNELQLSWRKSPAAEDGDDATYYQIYRDGALQAQTELTFFADSNLVDDTKYNYAIYAVDDQGNRNAVPLVGAFATKRDETRPQITRFFMPDEHTLLIGFSEPLLEKIALSKSNITINQGVEIEHVELVNNGTTMQIATSPHFLGKEYELNLEQMVDRAKNPNHLEKPIWKYRYTKTFEDDFTHDTSEDYAWHHEHTEGGFGRYVYDSQGRRLKVITGDDVAEKFAHPVPASGEGKFSFSFFPVKKYPDGGSIVVRLMENENSYYQISNTDGYGAGKIEKFIHGKIVAFQNFNREYSQNTKYSIQIHFNPKTIEVSGFAQPVTLKTNPEEITVRKFEIVHAQQNAYFDDIHFEGK